MADVQEIERKFWKALKSDRTMMLGFDGDRDSHLAPMTAQFDDETRGIWFFTSTDNAMAQRLGDGAPGKAVATFVDKGHDLFATVHGSIQIATDRRMIDRLWNRFVAAWFEGKDDPKLVLLRFDAARAEVWIDASSVIAGIKMLLGADPKQDYKDKVAEVDLRR
jgi:general stress protein 26